MLPRRGHGEDARHVVAQWPVDHGERDEEEAGLQEAGRGV
ncbi:hypothetical protein C791_1854 [Amycolatopsis azurea DSM 43854]|uniref:Uncharacterized protein n=1 Tax=Amycolatopsis azurea DSM 43854 TaxID=1238180 RepID=M2QQ84_9PSEU|nr:hypothetical protein C791_1854 [Amycolatopsis azurea DSM 43854]